MSVQSIKNNLHICIKNCVRKSFITLLITCVLIPIALAAFLMFFSLESQASVNTEKNILMAYTEQDFDKTLQTVKQQLVKKGFQVAHVQRCDNGLKKMGYEVNKYQVIFFGRLEEVREISAKHAELSPFLPFKLLIYIEGDKTVMSIMNPIMLKPMVTDKAIIAKLEQWQNEFIELLTQAKQVSLAME